MMKKNKILIVIVSILFSIFFMYDLSYADSFISPKLKIESSGIRFDAKDSTTETSFKDAENEVKAINTILKEYRLFVTFASGIVSLTMIGLFIMNLIKLGNTKGNPQARNKVITALIFTGVATALAGSVTTIVGLFYNFL